MAQASSSLHEREGSSGAADFDRPLLLTPHEDRVGWLAGHAGRLVLFGVAASSVAAVLLIFVFIIREAAGFFLDPAALPPIQGESVASWVGSVFA